MAASTPTPTPSYPYRPLDPGGRAIRVLKLSSADDRRSEVECRIEHVDLDNSPVYEALSYAWGDASDRREMVIDGHRHHHGPCRVLWADALCINQRDLAEKAAQIRLMYEIFASAAAVMAWVGEASDDVDEAFAAAMALNDTIRACSGSLSRPEIMPWPGTLLEPGGFGFSERNWDPLWRLLRRPYFTRVWIVQELRAATEGKEERGKAGAIVCCGSSGVRASVFHMICLWLKVVTPNLSNMADHMPEIVRATNDDNAARANRFAENLRGFDRYRNADGSVLPGVSMMVASIPKPTELHPQMLILALASKLAATEPRDKVYALLGLFGEEYNNFPIDYHEDLRRHPSWRRMQASWTLDPYQVSIEAPDGFPEDTLYRTGGSQPPVTAWDKQAKMLAVRGLRLSRLKTVAGPFRHDLHSILTLSRSVFPALNKSGDVFEKIWKTALRVADGLQFGQLGVFFTQLHAVQSVYRTVASLLWAPSPAPPAVEELYALFYALLGYGGADSKNVRGVLTFSLSGGGSGVKPIVISKATARQFLARLRQSLADRYFCVAESSHYVVGPYGSRPGD
ncbi:HET-domain-containing protein [Parathielavia hyrcaniae]|uniref:HET-domain-containing protein n=1 Tax=Parathielavia hyrcaniae TaxID=113614 RepID=A0AAN6Q1F9_9PEZI|nr:HET-domain-containing protein [Parathielavia hyrcaniae]